MVDSTEYNFPEKRCLVYSLPSFTENLHHWKDRNNTLVWKKKYMLYKIMVIQTHNNNNKNPKQMSKGSQVLWPGPRTKILQYSNWATSPLKCQNISNLKTKTVRTHTSHRLTESVVIFSLLLIYYSKYLFTHHICFLMWNPLGTA